MRLTHRDPRAAAVTYPRLTVATFLIVTVAMVYGNVVAKKGGVLDNPILDADNPYRVSDRYVQSRQADGLYAGENIPFILRFPKGINTPADLRRIRDFTERVKAQFGSAVLSLSEIPEYRDTGDTLLNDPYIPAHLVPGYDVAAWKRRVAADPSVFGVFLGRNFEWVAVFRYLPLGYDEIDEFRRTVEFVEEREIPWWEWLSKTDIEAPDDLGISGWVIGRGLIDQGLNVDIFTLTTVGIALAFPIFIWCLGSVRNALIGVVGVVLMGLLWARGTIGLLDALGFGMRERLYTLLAYTNCIVQGVSFVLHKFEAFNDTPSNDPVTERWRQARGNDHLIFATGIIAIFGFATLYWFQVLSIRELGLLSAIAVSYQLVLVSLGIPALHTLVSRGGEQVEPRISRAAFAFQRAVDGVMARCTALITHAAPGRTAALAGGLTLGLALVAVLLIWPCGLLMVKTTSLQYMEGTLVGRTGAFLNEPGRLGFESLEFWVEPAAPLTDIYDPEFLASTHAFMERIRGDAAVREVVSIVDQVGRVSQESFDQPLPTTRQQARAAFNIVEADLNAAVARQLFYRGGVRVTLTCQFDDSIAQGQTLERSLGIARENHPQLRVSSFGKNSLYAQVDHYVRMGKPWNLFSSQVVVIGFCWFGVWLNNSRRRSTHSGGMRLSPLGGGIMMSAPFVFASAVMVLLMISLEIPLDAATAAVTALAINASIDFAIYYADAYQEGLALSGSHGGAIHHAMSHKGRVVVEDMILNAVCFLPLVTSRFQPIRETGWIMIVMLAACAFGTIVLMPALFYVGLRHHAAVRVTVQLAGAGVRPERADLSRSLPRTADTGTDEQ